MSDIIETLNKAIDMQVQQRIQEAQLDKTVLCQVLETDWTDASKGEYYVSEGEAKYVAYGVPDGYRTRDNVWVLIPKGDYNNQKLIVSKQVSDDNDAFIYVSPLDKFVQLTGNIIPNPIPEDEILNPGLVTNGGVAGLPNSRVLAELNANQESVGDKFSQLVNGFDRFGISAKFRTNLSNLQVLHGNYGLKITITFTSEVTKGGEKYNVQSENVVYLQVDDMFGNPFAYDTYFTQEKMFEVANALNTKIENIKIEFFEEDGSWWDVLGNQLNPAIDPINKIPNLFVKDVALYFGTAAENAANRVYLYSNSSAKFDVRDSYQDLDEYNTKTLETKFVYQAVDNNYYTINGFETNSTYDQLKKNNLIDPITVRWYKFHQQYDVDDDRAGAGWKDVTVFDSNGEAHLLIRDFILNNPNVPFEKFKVAFIMNDCGHGFEVINEDDSSEEKDRKQAANDEFNSETRYWSDELQFLNGDDQTWASMDLINSLKLTATDQYKGTYMLYNAAPAGQSKIINAYETQINRSIQATFKSYITGDVNLDKASEVKWYVPKNDTMIVMDKSLNEKLTEDTDDPESTNYYIFKDSVENIGNQLANGITEINYRINEYFNQRWINNKIKCKVVRNGKTYEQEIELKFGTHGVNGTEYSLLVSLGDEYNGDTLIARDVPAWTWGDDHKNNHLRLKAQLYNELSLPLKNKETPNDDGVSYSWEIIPLTHSDLPALFRLDGNRLYRTSVTNGKQFGAYLKCTATYNQKAYTQDLVVPLRGSEDWVDCTGTKEVIYTYQNTGPTMSSKDPYLAVYKNGEAVRSNPVGGGGFNVWWIYDKQANKWYGGENIQIDEGVRDLPYLKKATNSTDYVLVPPEMFYADENYAMSVQIWEGNNTLIWSQPILIYRDIYTNTVLNEWDGSQKIDSKNNRIMTASVFAGKKENNAFTGVIMGELQGETDNGGRNTGYGLYGRNKGFHAFGFNTNGTAYIGDVSRAQLLFDGTQSTIKNFNYPTKGIKIDFDGGFDSTAQGAKATNEMAPYIDIQGNGNQLYLSAEANRLIDARVLALNASDNNISDGNGGYIKTSLLHVGGNGFYLQTANYENSNNTRGLRINLSTGTLDSRDKLTITGAAGSKIKFGNVELGTSDASSGYLTSTGSLTFSGGTIGSSGGLYLSTNDYETKIKIAGSPEANANDAIDNWRLIIGNNFGVTKEGYLYASSGKFSGDISGATGTFSGAITIGSKFSVNNSGEMTSSGGTVGGWHIESNRLWSGSATQSNTDAGNVQISTENFTREINGTSRNNLRLAIGSKFAVKNDGTLYAESGVFRGTVYASSGSFTGSVYASSGTFSGTISAGNGSTIGSWVITDGNLYKVTNMGSAIVSSTGMSYLPNGLSLSSGTLTCGSIEWKGTAPGTYSPKWVKIKMANSDEETFMYVLGRS